MLESRTRKRVKEHKWNQHSNKSQFFKRLEEKSHAAIDDLTLIAEHVDEDQLREIFTVHKLEPLMRALMRPEITRKNNIPKYKPDRDRIFFLSFMYLTWSLNILSSVIDNRWAKQMYSEHELKLREIVHSLWHERTRKIEKKVK